MGTWMGTRSVALLALGLAACVGAAPQPPAQMDAPGGGSDDAAAQGDDAATTTFSFFITSSGGPNGGDLRANVADTDGLAGADAICLAKATAAVPAAASKQWRAYLSTSTVSARSRIGAGPWFNFAGVMVATSVDNLHDPVANNLSKTTSLDETGAVVNGAGDTPNVHDIITGSLANGMPAATHCNNWTSSAATGETAQTGHHDRMGGGADPTSWNSAHATSGCSLAAFQGSGGRGSFYCFAVQ